MGFSVSEGKGDRCAEKVRIVAKREGTVEKEIERDGYTISIDVIGFGRSRLAAGL